MTTADDSDFFFRSTLSDTAQGPVLAQVVRDQGYDNVGLLYNDEPYGQGLAASFAGSWGGTIKSVPIVSGQDTYLPELRESAASGGQALVVIAFEQQAITLVGEALDEGIYDRFFFGDSAKRRPLVQEIGGDRLGGMYGTAGAPAPDSASRAAWEASFIEEYGGPPVLTYVKETYDATVALALAAQAAGSINGAAIRDRLRAIGSPPGEIVNGTPEGIVEGLRLLEDGTEIDYEGVASSLDWDENGDLLRGFIGIWRFTSDEDIKELDRLFFQY